MSLFPPPRLKWYLPPAIVSVVALAACGSEPTSSGTACKSDADCKGDRVCEDDTCVDPDDDDDDGDSTGSGGGEPPAFDLSGAVAYALGEDHLYKVSAAGEVLLLFDAEVYDFLVVDDGVIVALDDGSFWLRTDGTALETPGGAKGQNAAGDVYFSTGDVFRKSTGAAAPVDHPLGDASVMAMSENIAVLRIEESHHIYDTMTQASYPIDGCNGPKMVALSDRFAFVDDCSDEALFDLQSGTRSVADTNGWNSEAMPVDDGAVLMSQSCPGGTDGYGLCHVSSTGEVTLLLAGGLDPLDAACCGDRNRALSGWGRPSFTVVETTGLSLVLRGTGAKTPLFPGAQVVQAAVGGDVVYAIGASGGAPMLARRDLGSGEELILDASRSYQDIQAVAQ